MTNPYVDRAEKWALQTSTIIGTATIIAAGIGGGVDASTGMPWLSALVGLVAGGVTAIVLPGHDPAPVVAGAEALVTAIESHQDDLEKATSSAQAVAATVSAAVPRIATEAAKITAQVQQLAPVAQAIAAASGKTGVAAIVGDAGVVLGDFEAGLATVKATSASQA
ncbi:hypothetical protein HN018_07015 [Lichenicola cladoniae]|uniref:Uncharacterized protein n=1 Tax=Lichenicola cladoniae TaxID=1484109 RepID=A0A6M8HNF2_9PROT|nr:hypothetical protein [Lichenicola cladoniae]NPD67324.1 hypothetical protein [Acetobacteraceae bacterium]QKE89825.1 hypothetical protein HN018_07015 [Lichenicola cladoniae]